MILHEQERIAVFDDTKGSHPVPLSFVLCALAHISTGMLRDSHGRSDENESRIGALAWRHQ
jgi:hypothetical protein